MILAHRIALDPTVKQRIAFAKACGVARFTYNWALAEWKRQYEAGEKPTAFKLQKQWNSIKEKEFPWVYDSPKDANQRVFTDLGTSFKRFFSKTACYPVFKKKHHRERFYLTNTVVSVRGKRVTLGRIGTVRLREPLRFSGKIMSATISREADRWFISISVETEVEKLPVVDKAVGIDLGIKTAVVLSDGTEFKAPAPLKVNLKKLRRLSKAHSRRVKGSNNRKKAAIKLARLHSRIKNIRKDWTHKVTTKTVRENQTICLEDLNVKGMTANRKLSRAISDIGFYEIRRQIEYKSLMYGRTVKIINRWLPTSKTCSNCGCKKAFLALSERAFHCTECGFSLDRDLNAARNILAAGIAVTACGPEGSGFCSNTETKPLGVETGTTPYVSTKVACTPTRGLHIDPPCTSVSVTPVLLKTYPDT